MDHWTKTAPQEAAKLEDVVEEVKKGKKKDKKEAVVVEPEAVPEVVEKETKKSKKDKPMDVKVSHLMFQHFLHIFLQADCSVAIENTIPHEAVPLVT